MKQASATIWVLLGARAGDNAQALELARRVGGPTVEKPLRFNRISAFPNLLTGAGFVTLERDVRATLQAPWPELVIATGRRTARISLAIKRASDGKTKVVQIGRPRLPLHLFDLVVTTPQYGLPAGPNVIEVALPFAVARDVSAKVLDRARAVWMHLPRPWTVCVIGAAKFPMRFDDTEVSALADGLNRLASTRGGSVIFLDSPRSAAGAVQRLADAVSAPQWLWQRGSGENPYQAALALADQLVVTSDSVSMVSEMVRTGKSVFVHHLPVSGLFPQWSARQGLAATLARAGLLSPPRDVQAFLQRLSQAGWIGNLKDGRAPEKTFVDDGSHAEVVRRVKNLLSVGG